MLHKGRTGDKISSRMIGRPVTVEEFILYGRWHVRCKAPDGSLRWEDEIQNKVVLVGRNHLLNVGLGSVAKNSTWFIGLTQGSPTPAAGDTMASHVGWTESTKYTEGVRQKFVPLDSTGGSIGNSTSVASFSMNAASTVGGAFLTTNSTKGGAVGTLYAAGAFTGGNKVVGNGDTLEVTATFTATT